MPSLRARSTTRVGVGTDLVLIADVADSIATFGERYVRRVYSPAEIATCALPAGGFDPARLAARFAAKEAVVKALQLTGAVPYPEIEVRNTALGSPLVTIGGSLAGAGRDRGLCDVSLSMSHEGDYAAAVVVALFDTRNFQEVGSV
jgi:holo-[acyl-carrier protein] synthase